ncbi:MAG: CDP-alcohol phosphatidyltransferase family protein [Actinomycetota bacterium]|nr:CDP-alcohol phosphatidyltransferase family protein [Actinomycetota bacterium]
MPTEQVVVTTDRVVTIPNALTMLRLVGVPLFLWLLFEGHDAAAIAVLMLSGFTDWLDGKLARQWQQVTRTGQLLDPVADRLYILAALLGLTAREIVPLWLTLLLLARDLVLAALVPVLRYYGHLPLTVNFLGKAATASLLYAFPLLLLGDGEGRAAGLGDVFGWAFAIWGTALYVWSGLGYAAHVAQVVAAARDSSRGADGTSTPLMRPRDGGSADRAERDSVHDSWERS